MKRTYRIALVGCGGRGRAHVPGVLSDPRLELVALADPIPEAATKLATDFGINVPIYADYVEMLATEKPDVVITALWTDLHLPAFQACVDAGVKVVMSEKPIAANWNECQTIAALAESSGVMLTFCHQRRFAAGNRAVRKMLAENRFGKIERMDLFSPPHLLDCGTHSVDQALSFNEESPITWVHGAVDLSSTVSYFGIPAEGMFTGMLRFANGVSATIRTGRLDMDLWGGVRITGIEGFIEVMWDGQIRRVVVYSEPGWTLPYVDEPIENQMEAMVHHVIDCLDAGTEPEISHRHAMRAGEVLFALYESARIRERIELPLTGVTRNPLFVMLDDRPS